ncbi:related to human G protein-coupled receptor [Cephalotrichum gorgonifer]|uniref:GPI-anchored wall transfer protein n=1 Tax=Cephalotrichum gorgonifer TaxID=2041049 RepID=A0AAE8N080_9PEZI|nr:related to human G protein-coupled receptor [Cephalotrichum gorgonifer]
MSDPAKEYKQLKEDFVSNLTGGSIGEINLVTAIVPVSVLLWSVLQKRHSFFKPYTVNAFGLDYLINVGTVLLSFTLYSSQPLLLNALLIVPALAFYLTPPDSPTSRKKPDVPPKAKSKHGATATPDALGALPLKPFLTTYRGSMIVATCIAILAVDFRLFPRRFAKVETWGTSLMDLGVGSFVFSAGIVAARPVLKERAAGAPASPLAPRLVRSLRHSLSLLVLGVIRTLSIKGLDYAEHVSEYGVHWNFFFTLGLLPPFVAAFQSALAIVPSYAALAVVLAGLYEAALDKTELGAFVLTAPRTDLLSMNKEGIFSFFGYLAIFLAGQGAGMYMLPRNISPRPGTTKGAQRKTLLLTMAAWSAAWAALYFFATSYDYGLGLSVSRRLANLPYVLWVAAFNTAQILACCIIDTVFFPESYKAVDVSAEEEAHRGATSRLLRSFNRNGLALFLLANLLTGAVNMTVATLDAAPILATGILVGYTFVLCSVAIVLDELDISIKL